MCGRFTLKTPASQLASWFRETDFPVLTPRYNIAPTQQVLALRHRSTDHPEAVWMRWGLIPSWAKDTKIGNQLINARSETAASKPAFRRAYKNRRCVILADGFYEWKALAGGKQPFFIQPNDREHPIFCFAGLWESWAAPSPEKQSDDKTPRDTAKSSSQSKRQASLFEHLPEPIENSSASAIIESCTVLTTSANGPMAPLHDRMPVILDEKDLKRWLADTQEAAELEELLQPCPDQWLRIHPVSKQVNRPAFDDAACIKPVELEFDL